ncbi:MAG: hypothetical protein Q9O62_14410 [Ardenticatenia bacterium]|nr:hypothetical protein [Ardenticatenia bacterium]
MNNPNSVRHQVFSAYHHLLRVRQRLPAFHPNAAQHVLDVGTGLFGLVRTPTPANRAKPVLCLVNVTSESQPFAQRPEALGLPPAAEWHDLIGETHITLQDGVLRLRVRPYQALWLVPAGEEKVG